MFEIFPEQPGDGPEIESLLDQSFGPGRRNLGAYCLRRDNSAMAELSFVMRAAEGGRFGATIRFWPLLIDGRHGALLLGPLAVKDSLRGQGLGRRLIRHSLERAKDLGHGTVLVIGAPAYYQPFGFSTRLAGSLVPPPAVDRQRFQACELIPGALSGVSGRVRRADALSRAS